MKTIIRIEPNADIIISDPPEGFIYVITRHNVYDHVPNELDKHFIDHEEVTIEKREIVFDNGFRQVFPKKK